jgi:hypothetical protein
MNEWRVRSLFHEPKGYSAWVESGARDKEKPLAIMESGLSHSRSSLGSILGFSYRFALSFAQLYLNLHVIRMLTLKIFYLVSCSNGKMEGENAMLIKPIDQRIHLK